MDLAYAIDFLQIATPYIIDHIHPTSITVNNIQKIAQVTVLQLQPVGSKYAAIIVPTPGRKISKTNTIGATFAGTYGLAAEQQLSSVAYGI